MLQVHYIKSKLAAQPLIRFIHSYRSSWFKGCCVIEGWQLYCVRRLIWGIRFCSNSFLSATAVATTLVSLSAAAGLTYSSVVPQLPVSDTDVSKCHRTYILFMHVKPRDARNLKEFIVDIRPGRHFNQTRLIVFMTLEWLINYLSLNA